MIRRYWSTLCYLLPVQIYYRPFFLFKLRWWGIRYISPTIVEAAHICKAQYAPRNSSEIVFVILNMPERYVISGIEWHDRRHEKLWRYEINYFNFLQEDRFDQDTKIFLILDWVEKNPKCRAETWAPYVISRRVTNWVKWLGNESETNGEWQRIVLESLYLQLKRLHAGMEYHLQANHLFENFKALNIGATYLLRHGAPLYQKEIESWQRASIKGLRAQLKEQIFDDGAHYERSPMYHAIVMDGIHDLQVYGAGLREECETLLPKMQMWFSYLTHPDGKIALFQDSAFNGVPQSIKFFSPRTLPLAVGENTVITQLLEPSGYFIRRWGNGNYFVMDCGDPSPRYQPAHAHCSALSYELSLNGQRVVVDSGNGAYQNPQVRAFCRSTAAHNVPMIEGVEQSEIWGAFRMGRRVKVLSRHYDAPRKTLECRIRDYQENIFVRRVTFREHEIMIEDALEKRAGNGVVQSLVHFHPMANTSILFSDIPLKVVDSFWYPEFGRQISNKVVYFFGNSYDRISYHIAI